MLNPRATGTRSIRVPALLLLFAAASPAAHASFGLDDFKRAIEASGASTLPQAVDILSKNLKGDFTAVFQSNSIQQATEIQPRVIFWDEDSDFAATFSGIGDERNALEIFQFDPKAARFDFLRVKFPLQVSPSGTPEFKPAHEASCQACHGADPRPIWGEYPAWSGVFGSDNDLFSAPEKARFESFVAHAKSDPLYAPLFASNVSATWPTYPYREENGPIAKIHNAAKFRPNQRLGQLSARLNAARVMRLIRANPRYRENIPALLYGFMGCNGNGIQQTPAALTKLAGISLLDLDLRVTYKADSQTLASLESGPSYFDGSASMNELIASKIFEDAVSLDHSYDGVYFPRGLFLKYHPGPRINNMDIAHNQRLDRLGTWIPTPFDPSEVERKHRERFRKNFRENWETACAFVAQRAQADQIAMLEAARPPAMLVKTAPAKPAAARDAFGYYRQYCARCHAGASAVSPRIETREKLLSQGMRLIDQIQRGRMPRGQNDWLPEVRASWLRDRALMIDSLATETAPKPISEHASSR